MITARILPILALLAIGAAPLVSPQLARADAEQVLARKLHAEGRILSLEQILEKAKIHRAGTVIEAEFEVDGSLYLYELEILDGNGVVWELELDATSGKLLKLERD